MTDEPGSFLKRAETHLNDLIVELLWANGDISEVQLRNEQSDDNDVRFLSQRFVERLCSEDHIGENWSRKLKQ